jgi:TRAP-type C4-dicarboxylate transport system permease large subunit
VTERTGPCRCRHYGVLTGTSIAQLFAIGIVPGFILRLGLLAYAWVSKRVSLHERASMMAAQHGDRLATPPALHGHRCATVEIALESISWEILMLVSMSRPSRCFLPELVFIP